jgi:hypothetical protein
LICAFLYLWTGLWIKSTVSDDQHFSKTALTFVSCSDEPAATNAEESRPNPWKCARPPQNATVVTGELEKYVHVGVHSLLVGTFLARDSYAQPLNEYGSVVQTFELVLGPLLLALMALAIRRRFQR